MRRTFPNLGLRLGMPGILPLRDGICVGSILFVTAALSMLLVYDRAADSSAEQVRSSLVQKAVAIAALVDVELHSALQHPEQEFTPAYEQAVSPLRRVLAALPEIRYLYTVVLRDGRVHFVLDATPRGDTDGDGVEDHSALLDEYSEADPEMLAALRSGQAQATKRIYRDRWGALYSAYAPFFDAQGQVAGVLGLDITAEEYVARIGGVRQALGWGGLLAAIFSGLAGAWTFRLRHRMLITERAHCESERQLSEKQRTMATLLSNLPGMVYRCRNEPHWPMEFMSEGALELTGYRVEALTAGQPSFVELIRPEDRRPVWDRVQEAVARGAPFQLVYRIRTADGSEKWVWERGRGVFDADGRLLALEGFISDITSRKRAEQAVREERDRFEAVIEQAPLVAIQGFDREGRIRTWNSAAEALYGYPRSKALALNVKDLLLDAEEVARFNASLAELLRTQRATPTMEWRVRTQTGEPRWVLSSMFPVFRDGGVSEVFCMGVDITARRESEEALARLARAVDATADAVVITDRDGRIQSVNPAFTHITGFSAAEAIGRTPAVLKSGTHPPELYRDMWATITRGEIWRGDVVNRRKDGTLYHAALTISPIVGESGACEGYVGVQRDVTLERTAEQRLQAAADFQRTVIETAATAIFTVDAERRITSVNRAFTAATGYAPEEVLGRPCAMLEVDSCAATSGLFNTQGAGPTYGKQCVIRTRDGRHIDTLTNADTLTDSAGHVIGGVVSFVDVTALVEARRAAELASRSKSEFLATMSHEIRTPMTAILGFADQLLDPGLSPDERRNASLTIRRNAQHLLDIINDILDLSKIEAGKLTVELVPCSPAQVVADVQSLMQGRASARGLRFEVERHESLPPAVRSDPLRLKQILVNLVGNAIKFTEYGHVRLVARFLPTPAPRLQFEVSDTGIGISPAQLATLFLPFSQADRTTARHFGGTGLGLMISRQLAQLLGGDIEVESTVGVGSTFRVTVAAERVDPAALQTTTARDPARMDAVHLPIRVLVADDGPDNQRLVAALLKKVGATVETAVNGRAAVNLALDAVTAGRPFDVILMDIQMPILDGYEATARLRGHGYRRPIIALTAHAMAQDREKCLRAGFDDYVSKPIDRGLLYETLQRWTAVEART